MKNVVMGMFYQKQKEFTDQQRVNNLEDKITDIRNKLLYIEILKIISLSLM
jgi:hypothetical protein